jgi:hypothetical protein
MKRYILNIVGPVAVGKSSVIEELKEYLPQYQVFGIDAYRKQYSNGTPEGDTNAWFEMFRHANGCKYIIVESTGTSYNLMQFISGLNNCELEICTVSLSASAATRGERKEERERAGYENPPMYFVGDVAYNGNLVLPANLHYDTETMQPYEIAIEVVAMLEGEFV